MDGNWTRGGIFDNAESGEDNWSLDPARVFDRWSVAFSRHPTPFPGMVGRKEKRHLPSSLLETLKLRNETEVRSSWKGEGGGGRALKKTNFPCLWLPRKQLDVGVNLGPNVLHT